MAKFVNEQEREHAHGYGHGHRLRHRHRYGGQNGHVHWHITRHGHGHQYTIKQTKNLIQKALKRSDWKNLKYVLNKEGKLHPKLYSHKYKIKISINAIRWL